MSLRSPAFTVSWEAHVPSTDVDGNEVDGWASHVAVPAFAFDPGDSATMRGTDSIHRDVTQPTLYLPLETPVAARGRVTVNGALYMVDGEPRPWSHPRLSLSGVVASLRRVDG